MGTYGYSLTTRASRFGVMFGHKGAPMIIWHPGCINLDAESAVCTPYMIHNSDNCVQVMLQWRLIDGSQRADCYYLRATSYCARVRSVVAETAAKPSKPAVPRNGTLRGRCTYDFDESGCFALYRRCRLSSVASIKVLDKTGYQACTHVLETNENLYIKFPKMLGLRVYRNRMQKKSFPSGSRAAYNNA